MILVFPLGSCEDVVKNIPTGTYLLDEGGRWAGTTSFDYSYAAYSFDLNKPSWGIQEYTYAMMDVYNRLSLLGQESEKHDLSYNLIMRMSWVMSYDDKKTGQIHKVRLTGNPAYVFKGDYTIFLCHLLFNSLDHVLTFHA